MDPKQPHVPLDIYIERIICTNKDSNIIQMLFENKEYEHAIRIR